jgi:hypothetical protein
MEIKNKLLYFLDMVKWIPNMRNKTESEIGLIRLANIINSCDVSNIIVQNKGHTIPFFFKNQ